jgi:hypothetical protein
MSSDTKHEKEQYDYQERQAQLGVQAFAELLEEHT